MTLPLQASLALEWMQASGPRTATRLRALVGHFCDTSGIENHDMRDAIYQAALNQAKNRIDFRGDL